MRYELRSGTGARSETGLQVCVQQLMKELFSGLSLYREPARDVRAGLQPTLNRFADSCVFVLDPLANGDAGHVALASLIGRVRKIEIENNLGPVNAARTEDIRVHYYF